MFRHHRRQGQNPRPAVLALCPEIKHLLLLAAGEAEAGRGEATCPKSPGQWDRSSNPALHSS